MNRGLWITRPDNTEHFRQRMMNIAVAVVAVLSLLLLLGLNACTESSETKETTTDVDTTNSSVAPSASVDSAVIDRHTVDIMLTDESISIPPQAAAGPTIFRVTNAGTHEHNIQVDGNGKEFKLDGVIPAGQTQTLTADLTAGTYEVYCPLEDHRSKGLSGQLVVQ
jgi:uncharacterized cupredoxin-like copper-binding protein